MKYYHFSNLNHTHTHTHTHCCNRISRTLSHLRGLTISEMFYCEDGIIPGLASAISICLTIPCLFNCISLALKPPFFHLQTCWLFLPHEYNLVWFFFIIKVFRTIVFIFIVISTTFRPICPPAFFRCLLSKFLRRSLMIFIIMIFQTIVFIFIVISTFLYYYFFIVISMCPAGHMA